MNIDDAVGRATQALAEVTEAARQQHLLVHDMAEALRDALVVLDEVVEASTTGRKRKVPHAQALQAAKNVRVVLERAAK